MKLNNQPTKSIKKTNAEDLLKEATEAVETAKKPVPPSPLEAKTSVLDRGLIAHRKVQSYRSNSSSLQLFSIEEEKPKNSSVIKESKAIIESKGPSSN
ncbi:hypothetical protein Lnau_1368 [Legionella nautarum]|uniref:Uncharacterized protein n=1 Tax=Legionella nautarum TaxID=45070 RepID=A0A0W0WVN7_9GAMM|nr:hypothetical protein [Legionella nautarum]KTD36384.1 hypothetical protein Lnau_1368 [Legionella nautarum]